MSEIKILANKLFKKNTPLIHLTLSFFRFLGSKLKQIYVEIFMLKFSEYTLSISIKHLCKFINYLFSKKDLFNIKAQYEIWHDELPDTHRILLRSSGSVLCDCSMSWLVRVFQRSISTVRDFLSVARASRWDCRSRMSDCSGRIVSSSFPSCGETHIQRQIVRYVSTYSEHGNSVSTNLTILSCLMLK